MRGAVPDAAAGAATAKRFAIPIRWSSVSLRLSAFFVALLVCAVLAVGFLFDQGRSQALRQRQLEHLRLHAERAADEVSGYVERLRSDAVFLAGTPPMQGIRRATEGGGADQAGGSSLEQWVERLAQIFLALAEARPQYFQLRLIGIADEGLELVRVERDEAGLRVTPAGALQQKSERYYFRQALELAPGAVYLSRIDLNREHGRISLPHRPTLRAAVPVRGADGAVFAVLVINMDMARVFERARAFTDAVESLHIADERGGFLYDPHNSFAFSFELGNPVSLAEVFPAAGERLGSPAPPAGFFEDPSGSAGEARVGYLTARRIDPEDSRRRLHFILTEPALALLRPLGPVRRESLLIVTALLVLATALVVVVVRHQTRSLAALAKASDAIAAGAFAVDLPNAAPGEAGSLVRAFRHMSAEVEQREQALADLNRDLEARVEARTCELARQHDLQRLILDNIGDGVVVVDADGRFILWNNKAEQIIGSGPEPVAAADWPSHFGVYTGVSGELVAVDDLPLVRAMRGEPMVDVELYLRRPQRGEGCWAQVTARPLRNARGEVTGAVAVLIDLTEKRRLQERLQAHRAELLTYGRLILGAEITSSAAHQLSQPLAAISNYASAAVRLHARGRLGEAELAEMLGQIERLSARAGDVLDRLRARIRRGERQSVAFDLNRTATSSLDFFSERIATTGVRVDREFADGLPALVGDPREMEHALIQLIANALEAMEVTAAIETGAGAGRHLCLRTGYDAHDGLIRVEVGDTGPGVSEAIAASLFEPWETDKPGALGIGLTIAQTIVEGFGGRIRMEKRRDCGSLFRVEIPLHRGAMR